MLRNLCLILATAAFSTMQNSKAAEIYSASGYLEPPKVSQLVQLVLTVQPRSPIPKNGSFRYVFPQEQSISQWPSDECVLQEPPLMIKNAKCTYSIDSATERLVVTISGFDRNLTNFLQLQIPMYLAPRSTEPSSSFQFESFTDTGDRLDYQLAGITVQASIPDPVVSLGFKSSSKVIGTVDQLLTTQLTILKKLLPSDQIQLRVPKWDPQSSNPQSMLELSKIPDIAPVDGSPINSTHRQIIAGDLFDTIVVKEAFTQEVDKGDTISFSVGPFKNPISGRAVTGFTLTILDKNGGIVMGDESVLIVSKSAQLPQSAVSLSLSDYMIQAYSTFEIRLDLHVPLEKGCAITITVPYKIGVDQNLNRISVYGMFGFNREIDFSYDISSQTIFLHDVCSRFLQPGGSALPAVIRIETLLNPEYVESVMPFYVVLTTIDGDAIVNANQGLSFSLTPGNVFFGEWFATNSVVSSQTALQIAVAPQHELTTDAILVIEFDNDDFVIPQNCTVLGSNFIVDGKKIKCEISKNATSGRSSFKIQTFLEQAFVPTEGVFIQVIIDDFRMPTSSRPTGAVNVQFTDLAHNRRLIVDQITQSDILRATPGDLVEVDVLPQLNETFFWGSVTISLTTVHALEDRSSIRVEFPDDMEIDLNMGCVVFNESKPNCTRHTSNIMTYQLPTTNRTQQPNNNQTQQLHNSYIFKVFDVRTPRVSRYSKNFRIDTLDDSGYVIDSKYTFQLPPQSVGKLMSDYGLSLSENKVSVLSSMNITFSSPVPLHSHDYMTIRFPAESLAQRFAFTFKSCESAILLSCSLVGLDILRIDSTSLGKQMPVDTPVQIAVNQVATPLSTKPSEPLEIDIFDQDGYIVTHTGGTVIQTLPLRLRVYEPNQLLFARVEQHSLVPLATTTYNFELITRNPIPAQGRVWVVLPDSVSINAKLLECHSSYNKGIPIRCLYDRIDHKVTLYNVTALLLPGGQTIDFGISGLINPEFATREGSIPFTVVSTDKDGNLIDQSSSDALKVYASCDYPCQQCMDGEPTKCLSCGLDDTFPLLYDGQCLKSCPSNYFAMDGICSQCHSGCLECKNESNICQRCHEGYHLLGNACLKQCPDQYYSDPVARACSSCELPCQTCAGSPQTCTSCNKKQPKQLYFQDYCHTECPPEISVYSLGQCLACDKSCRTCEFGIGMCTTCHGLQWLDLTTNTCQDQCPLYTTVPTIFHDGTKLAQVYTCEKCAEECAQCSPIDGNQCTKCHLGFKFVEQTSECLKECPASTAELQVPLTGDVLCVQCADGCAECAYDRDHCSACLQPGWFLLDFTCVKTCPHGYGASSGQCIRDELFCDWGYRLINGSCVLQVAHCEAGYELNASDNRCIALPGFQIPGVLLTLAAIWTAIVHYRRHRIDKSLQGHDIRCQLLIGLTLLQQMAYLVMFCLSFSLGYNLVTSLMTFATVAAVVLNLGASLAFTLVLAHRDIPFMHWSASHKQSNLAVVLVSALFSFKAVHLLVSRLCLLEGFNAVFQDRYRTYQKPLAAVTFAQTLLCAAPVCVVSVYLVVTIPIWGYEIRTLGIESTVLQVLITVLELYELIEGKAEEKSLPRVSDLLLGQKKKKKTAASKAHLYRVQAGVDEDSQLFEQAPPQQGLTDQTATRLNTTMVHQHSEVEILDHLVKQVEHNSNLKMLERSNVPHLQNEDLPLPNNARKAQRLFNQVRKQNELHRHQQKPMPNKSEQMHESVASEEETPKSSPCQEQKGSKALGSAIQLYETRSAGEVTRDNFDFTIHLEEQTAQVRKRIKRQRRRARSFDENVLRELYDDFGVESTFESQQSWVSYPMGVGLRANFAFDAYMLARAAMFAEKIKSKFQFNNCACEAVSVHEGEQGLNHYSIRTQTQNLIYKGRDPFDSGQSNSSSEFQESARILDSDMVPRMLDQIYDGLSVTEDEAPASSRSPTSSQIDQDIELALSATGRTDRSGLSETSKRDLTGGSSARVLKLVQEKFQTKDLDKKLGVPSPGHEYIGQSFRNNEQSTSNKTQTRTFQKLESGEDIKGRTPDFLCEGAKKTSSINSSQKPVQAKQAPGSDDYQTDNLENVINYLTENNQKNHRSPRSKPALQVQEVQNGNSSLATPNIVISDGKLIPHKRGRADRGDEVHGSISSFNEHGSSSGRASATQADGRQTSLKEEHESRDQLAQRRSRAGARLESDFMSSVSSEEQQEGEQKYIASNRSRGAISEKGADNLNAPLDKRQHRNFFDRYEPAAGYLFGMHVPRFTKEESALLRRPGAFQKDLLLAQQNDPAIQHGQRNMRTDVKNARKNTIQVDKIRNLESMYLRPSRLAGGRARAREHTNMRESQDLGTKLRTQAVQSVPNAGSILSQMSSSSPGVENNTEEKGRQSKNNTQILNEAAVITPEPVDATISTAGQQALNHSTHGASQDKGHTESPSDTQGQLEGSPHKQYLPPKQSKQQDKLMMGELNEALGRMRSQQVCKPQAQPRR